MSHFLKKLELNGFKSFAEKTVLEFPAGIVAIVGPNGSGKSNVVDAIRWLLGERDAKNLRGGKGEDLIFAGTQKRARVGQAQASLYFDNTSKFFPVDFDEVVVTREIRRDGQNKYFLNRSEVLLRDLIDFFAKARLGSKGLIIVGQGDSDLFVRSSPLERRAMIEEILGLREYQIKKSDAERRLKNSRINLDKVRALIEEILPHLRSLKRQTSRWERRGELETELHALEDQYFGHQFAELRSKAVLLDERLKAEQTKKHHLEALLRDAEQSQVAVEASRPVEQADLSRVREEIRTLGERKNALQKDIGRLEAQIEMAERSAAKTAGSPSLDAYRELVSNVRAKIEAALQNPDPAEAHAALRSILAEVDHVTAQKKVAEPVPVNDAFAKDLARITADLAALDAAMVELRERERSFEGGQEEFYRSFKSAVEAVQAAKNALDGWERSTREQALEKDRLALRREEIVRQVEQAGRRAEEFAIEDNAEGASAMEVERRMFRLRGDLAAIGEVDEALVKEAQDTEARYAFLEKESSDLDKAVVDLTGLLSELTQKIATEFEASLGKINEEFSNFFGVMFGGGTARLKLKEQAVKAESAEGETAGEVAAEEDIEESEDERSNAGIEIEIKLPRKKITSLDMLSGGERSLVGIAALFALVSVSPPPFLLLDEIDAPLDERNARRFADMLKSFSGRTQFVVVTHNRATMEAADILYGVTLNEDGTSKILSVKFDNEAKAA